MHRNLPFRCTIVDLLWVLSHDFNQSDWREFLMKTNDHREYLTSAQLWGRKVTFAIYGQNHTTGWVQTGTEKRRMVSHSSHLRRGRTEHVHQ